jgi:NitT/TauT family transport system substrate-binding protein
MFDRNRRKFLQYCSLGLGATLLPTACTPNGKPNTVNINTGKLDKINFGLSWVAEAEYGGFYQAIADGIYREHGLDVKIVQGGPRVNVGLLLMLGALDLAVGTGFEAVKAIETNLPKITVAAIFQKSSSVIIAHPNTGVSSIGQLKGRPIYMASAGAAAVWPFFRRKYGFTDSQLRPYNFDVKPFLANKNVAQQGILTSEPFTIEKEGKFKPVVMLYADAGYNPYDFTIETTKRLVETKPELVQKFVDASIKGWYSYLRDPTKGNVLIKKDNPEMTDELLNYSLNKLKEIKVINGGEAELKGIGMMTDARWKTLFDDMVKVGVYKSDTNYREAYTTQFIGKGKEYYQPDIF